MLSVLLQLLLKNRDFAVKPERQPGLYGLLVRSMTSAHGNIRSIVAQLIFALCHFNGLPSIV